MANVSLDQSSSGVPQFLSQPSEVKHVEEDVSEFQEKNKNTDQKVGDVVLAVFEVIGLILANVCTLFVINAFPAVRDEYHRLFKVFFGEKTEVVEESPKGVQEGVDASLQDPSDEIKQESVKLDRVEAEVQKNPEVKVKPEVEVPKGEPKPEVEVPKDEPKPEVEVPKDESKPEVKVQKDVPKNEDKDASGNGDETDVGGFSIANALMQDASEIANQFLGWWGTATNEEEKKLDTPSPFDWH